MLEKNLKFEHFFLKMEGFYGKITAQSNLKVDYWLNSVLFDYILKKFSKFLIS